jgi:hypothetical protein
MGNEPGQGFEPLFGSWIRTRIWIRIKVKSRIRILITVTSRIRIRIQFVRICNTAAQDLMWTDARDMWYLAVDSCWAEFLLLPRPLPLIDALPLAAWLYAKPKGKLHLSFCTAN